MSDIKLDWGTGIPPIAATTAKDEIISQQGAEIERLRGLLGDVQIIMDSHNNIVGNLNGEITRLRGLLREGLDHHDEYNWQQRVREALGEK